MKNFSDYKNILIYRIGHLGDTIVALPAFWEIRNKFPDSNLTLLTNSDSKHKNYITAQNILPEKGLIDHFLHYDNSVQKLSKAKTFTKLFIQLKKNKYDCLFYLSTRNRTNYQIERDIRFFNFAGIREIFGVKYLKENHLNFQQPRPLPAVEPEYKFLLKCLPFDKTESFTKIKYNIELTDFEKEDAAIWIEEKCGSTTKKKFLVAVAPGSKWSSKLWSEKNYIKILSKLIEQFNVIPIIFGGQEDFEVGQRIISHLKKGINTAGEFSIRKSFAVLNNCALYLGNDTGTMHMAAAVDTPCVAVFAATDYKNRWYPFGENNKIFRYSVECEGCHTPLCYNNHKCLKMITTTEVYEACREILENERLHQ